jgi:hypothetical protein
MRRIPSMRQMNGALRAWRRSQDDGMALVVVLGVMTVLTAFLLVLLAGAVQNLKPTRADQDAKAAMAAAEAGIEEYVSRLNANDNYWGKGNDDDTNPAFTAAGAPVPGATGSNATFRYRLVTSPAEIASTGKIRLEVTGASKANDDGRLVERTLTASLQPAGFLDFVYLTIVEDLDPALFMNRVDIREATYNGFKYAKLANGSTGGTSTDTGFKYITTPSRIEQDCSKYYYAGRNGRQYTATSTEPTSADAVLVLNGSTATPVTTASQLGKVVRDYTCTEIQFTTGDEIKGPLHSNDALQVNGSVLFSRPRTESSWPACQTNPAMNCWWGTGTPKGASEGGYKPTYAPPIQMPPGNETLLQHVAPRIDKPGAPPGEGCLYTGATRITFVDDMMKVYSPNTTNPATPARCLDLLKRGEEQLQKIPPVIYVAGTTGSCSGVGFPVTGGSAATTESTTQGYTTDYSCTKGTVMVKGTVKGQVTVSAVNDIVVTGNLVRKDRSAGSTDVVGLIAENNVWVYHPVNSSNTNLLTSANAVRQIDAAILSVKHSFLVQNWDKGAALSSAGDDNSKLNITGAIAQRFRGPVGTGGGSSGYLKNYMYDDRLAWLQPPYFLTPSSSPWITKKISDG